MKRYQRETDQFVPVSVKHNGVIADPDNVLLAVTKRGERPVETDAVPLYEFTNNHKFINSGFLINWGDPIDPPFDKYEIFINTINLDDNNNLSATKELIEILNKPSNVAGYGAIISNGIYTVILPINGSYGLHTRDGKNWEHTNILPIIGNWNSMFSITIPTDATQNNKIRMIIFDQNAGMCMYSDDGINWLLSATNPLIEFFPTVWVGEIFKIQGRLILVCQNYGTDSNFPNNKYMYSDDYGVNWFIYDIPIGYYSNGDTDTKTGKICTLEQISGTEIILNIDYGSPTGWRTIYIEPAPMGQWSFVKIFNNKLYVFGYGSYYYKVSNKTLDEWDLNTFINVPFFNDNKIISISNVYSDNKTLFLTFYDYEAPGNLFFNSIMKVFYTRDGLHWNTSDKIIDKTNGRFTDAQIKSIFASFGSPLYDGTIFYYCAMYNFFINNDTNLPMEDVTTVIMYSLNGYDWILEVFDIEGHNLHPLWSFIPIFQTFFITYTEQTPELLGNWLPPKFVGTRIGFELQKFEPGIYDVWAKLFTGLDTPVIKVESFKVE